jgi:hypothetical protein
MNHSFEFGSNAMMCIISVIKEWFRNSKIVGRVYTDTGNLIS